MVTGRNSLEPLGYVTAKILLFIPKADTWFSHNRALKTHPWKKLESKLETGHDQENFYLAQP